MMKRIDINKPIKLRHVLATALDLSMHASPVLFITAVLLYTFKGAVYGLTSYATQSVFDAIEAVLNGNGALATAAWMMLLLGGIYIMRNLCDAMGFFISSVLGGRNNRVIHFRKNRKVANLDPISLEDVNIHDDLNKAGVGAGTTQNALMAVMTLITFNVTYWVIMSIYLYSLKPLFIVFILVAFVPQYIGEWMKVSIVKKNEDLVAPKRRQFEFYEKAVCGTEFMKETRLLGGFKFFFGRYGRTLRELNREEWKAQVKMLLVDFASQIFVLAGYGVMMFMLVDALLKGEISVGAFAGVFSSVGAMFHMAGDILWRVSKITTFVGTAHNYVRFMNLPEREGAVVEADRTAGIVAKDVTFYYPNTDHPSLSDVSLNIKAGEKIAIVGENGAGKTTLARLLLGIYLPCEGEVTLQGMPTVTTDPKTLYRGVSGVFQKFGRYPLTLSDNIRISDFGSEDDPASVAGRSGVDIDSPACPEGLETMLSRDFGGVELSGGQWQRVAIARGLYRSHDVIVLDEPTSAIDPIEESAIYRKFMELSDGKTAIIVTHRLGSVKIADRILVMDKGRIVEEGTHDSLMSAGGMYHQMYQAQKKWYEEIE